MRINRDADSDMNIINMSSLLDVMFILIIFFLATATFEEEEHDEEVNLPSAAPTQSISAAPKMIVVNVRKDGTYLVSTRQLDLEGLKRRILDAVTGNTQQKVLIRGDREALHGHVANAVAVCRQAGVLKANIGYQYAATGP